MKKRYNTVRIVLFALCVLSVCITAHARKTIKVEKPNLEEIKKAVLDPTGEFYFPNLEKMYLKNDTVMTPQQFRYFYLGYMFQEDYDPYRESEYTKYTDELRQKGGNYTSHELDTIIKYSELVLKDNPFDLRQMSWLVHALKQKKKDYRAKFWEYKLENLLGAIKSTGTGDSTENAWYVIYPMHEYDMVQLLGYQAVDAEYPAEGIDYLLVEPTADTQKRLKGKVAKGFYFNVLIPQQQYEMKHPGEEDEGTPEESYTTSDE